MTLTYSLSYILSKQSENKQITSAERYNLLILFTNKYGSLSTNNKVKYTGINSNIPYYLKDKYGNVVMPKSGEKSLSIKVKNILSRMAQSNYREMIKEFDDLKIDTYKIHDEIHIMIYDTIIDLIYLVDVYINLIDHLKDKYPELYKKFMNKVREVSLNHIVFTDNDKETKRWRTNHAILIGKLYNKSHLTDDEIIKVISHHMHKCLPNNDTYICLICNIISNMNKKLPKEFGDQLFEFLEAITLSKDYDFKVKVEIEKIFDLI